MSKIKVIKTEQDYQEALKLVEELMNFDPNPNSEEGEKLNLLGTLIEDYESRVFPETLPDPIEAIKFRMEQSDLKPADLIPYVGSRSRVSEILSGKRQLTLDMVRALSDGLGIPAKVLIRKPEINKDLEYETWDNRLVAEMEKRGYFGSASIKSSKKSELLSNFFSIRNNHLELAVMHRKSHYRSSPLTSRHALDAWAEYVFKMAQKEMNLPKFKKGAIDLSFMQKLAKVSAKADGPLVIKELLREIGVVLVIEKHFQKTYLDGATVLFNKNNPIIGLTLRHDRLDNFWFTLMHELAHIALHFDQDIDLFYDEIEGVKGAEISDKEREADALAREALVPASKWEASPAKLIPSPMAAQSLANELGVHMAIVAGIMRHEHKNYYYLNKIVNSFKVKRYFE